MTEPALAKARASFQGISDSRLIEAFVASGDQSAFGELIRRHAALVFGVCHRVLGNAADAEDAFQGTFLVLALKARSVRQADLLANWLHGVALRTARQARMLASRRAAQERRFMRLLRAKDLVTANDSDCRLMIDELVGHLPEKYRSPIVLCYLEGKTKSEAACELGWPEGTVSSRLNRARGLLRNRMRSAGKIIGAVALAEFLCRQAGAATIPESLIGSTLTTTASPTAVTAGTAKSFLLAKGVVRAMFITKVSVATVCVIVPAACLVAAAAVGRQAARDQGRVTASTPSAAQSVGVSTSSAAQNPDQPVNQERPFSRTHDLPPAVGPARTIRGTVPAVQLAAQPRDVRVCSNRIRELTMAAILYMSGHRQHFPPDLGATLPYILRQNATQGEMTKAALAYLSPLDQNSVKIPDKLTPEWINQNTSFVYLADGHTVTRGIEHAYEVVLVHEKLTADHDGKIVTGYCDGHACAMPRAEAEKDIEQSKRVFANSRD